MTEVNENTPNLESTQSQESTEQSSEELESSQENTELEASPDAKKEEPKAPVKKTTKKIKLKVDKNEFDEELPFEIPDDEQVIDYMRKTLQMGKMGQKRAQEFAELQKDVQSFIELLRNDPEAALSDPAIGLDVKALAAKIIEKEIENSKKTPEQLEKEELQNKLKKLEEERQKEKQEAMERERERLSAEAAERYDREISAALEKSDLPKSSYTIKKIAEYMLTAVKDGLDVTAEDVLPLVKEEMHKDLKEMFAVMPDEVIEQLIGKDVFTRVRKKNLQKAKENQAPAPVKSAVKDTGASDKPSDDKADKAKSMKDFFGF